MIIDNLKLIPLVNHL